MLEPAVKSAAASGSNPRPLAEAGGGRASFISLRPCFCWRRRCAAAAARAALYSPSFYKPASGSNESERQCSAILCRSGAESAELLPPIPAMPAEQAAQAALSQRPQSFPVAAGCGQSSRCQLKKRISAAVRLLPLPLFSKAQNGKIKA